MNDPDRRAAEIPPAPPRAEMPGGPLLTIRATTWSLDEMPPGPDGKPVYVLQLANGIMSAMALMAPEDLARLKSRINDLTRGVGLNGQKLVTAHGLVDR